MKSLPTILVSTLAAALFVAFEVWVFVVTS